jgi:ABC transporter substrate binding protein (PQQ-dependent alcohol dehydrogenase system)
MKRFLAAVFVLLVGLAILPGPAASREATVEQLEERAREDLERQKKREERGGKTHQGMLEGDIQTLQIVFLTQEVDIPPPLSNLDPFVADEGVQGARLGIQDNATTGVFTKQGFELREETVPIDGDLVAAFKALVADGYRHVIVNLPGDKILRLADLPEAEDVVIYNASAPDDRLRNEDCRANVFHTIPSRAMLADALAQYLVKKRWNKWFLVIGQDEADRLYAEVIKRAAKRFGAKIVEERSWTFTHDARRTAQSEVPVFTQGVKYQVLVVTDEEGRFGEYLSYRTWDPRLVAGTQGLVATAWHRTHERWGATQMQNRFRREANRWMTSKDYAAWIAVRSLGEAATRTKSVEFEKLRDYIVSSEFSLAAFKGVKVTYRPWNRQLRMRILLSAPRSLVSVSPQQGFLHHVSEMDTLGYDEPESACKLP